MSKNEPARKTRQQIVVGETYGKITIMQQIKRKSYPEYLCKCNLCGEEFVTRGYQLHNSAENGCPTCRGYHKIIVGETYGNITVLSRTEERPLRYSCRCEICGGMITITGQRALQYAPTGCPSCRDSKKYKDLEDNYKKYIGTAYGDLIVIDYVGKKYFTMSHGNKTYAPVMRCRCEKCGEETEIFLSRLKHGGAKQCAKCSQKNLDAGREYAKELYISGTCISAIDSGRKLNKNSSTGHNGVSRMGSGMYRAYINFKRKQYSLGSYIDIKDAVAARKKAEEEIYGNFLKWYADTYPEKWKKIQKRT